MHNVHTLCQELCSVYTTGSEQGAISYGLWHVQASGEDGELQKHREKARTQIWDHAEMALALKTLPASAGDLRKVGSVPGSRRSPGGRHGNPLQYSCLKIPWTEEPGSLQFIGSQGVGHEGSDLACMHIDKAVINSIQTPLKVIGSVIKYLFYRRVLKVYLYLQFYRSFEIKICSPY